MLMLEAAPELPAEEPPLRLITLGAPPPCTSPASVSTSSRSTPRPRRTPPRPRRTGSTWRWSLTDCSSGSSRWRWWWELQGSSCRRPASTTTGYPLIRSCLTSGCRLAATGMNELELNEQEPRAKTPVIVDSPDHDT